MFEPGAPSFTKTKSKTGDTPMKNLRNAFIVLLQDESGQDLIEYALVAGLIGLGAVVAMTSLSTKVGSAFNTVGNSLTNAV
jgi:pilus assembly protein Flp/PilA